MIMDSGTFAPVEDAAGTFVPVEDAAGTFVPVEDVAGVEPLTEAWVEVLVASVTGAEIP